MKGGGFKRWYFEAVGKEFCREDWGGFGLGKNPWWLLGLNRRAESLPAFEILDACYPLLRIAYHLTEEIGKAGTAELGGTRPIEVSVVDGFPVGGRPETTLGGSLRRRVLWGVGWGWLGALRGIHLCFMERLLQEKDSSTRTRL